MLINWNNYPGKRILNEVQNVTFPLRIQIFPRSLPTRDKGDLYLRFGEIQCLRARRLLLVGNRRNLGTRAPAKVLYNYVCANNSIRVAYTLNEFDFCFHLLVRVLNKFAIR